MDFLDKKFVRSLKSVKAVYENASRGKKTAVFGVSKFFKAYILHGFEEFALFVTADYGEAAETLAALNSYGGNFVYLPPGEEVLFSRKPSLQAGDARRSEALFHALCGKGGIVTTAEAVMQKYPFAESFRKNTVTLVKGENADVLALAEKLVKMGYRRDEDLPQEGTFARRGDIMDIFCIGQENPVRLSFFGDTIEDIRTTDRESKKSVEKLGGVTVVPVRAFFSEDFDAEKLTGDINRSRQGQKLSADAHVRLSAVCAEIAAEIEAGMVDNPWVLPFVKHSSLFDYLPQNAVVVWDEPKLLGDRIKLLAEGRTERAAYLLEKGEILPEHILAAWDGSRPYTVKNDTSEIAFSAAAGSFDIFRPDEIVSVNTLPVANYRGDFRSLGQDIKTWTAAGLRVAVFGGDELAEHLPADIRALCKVDDREVRRGFVSHDDKLVLIGRDDSLAKPRANTKLKSDAASVFIAPSVGDYVVHETHGIGRCEGIVTLDGSFGVKDFILAVYRDGDKLYVPVESANLLARYSGKEGKPKLSKLGGGEFEKVKERTKKSIKEMAINLAALYREREKPRGFVYASDEYLERRFADAFPHEETTDQLKCIADIFDDLNRDKIMDRLICGDVGYGKTEVALRAAFKVILSGRQVAFLSPTTILCEQHFGTVSKRFDEFGIKTECLNRFRTAKEQAKIVAGLGSGAVNFVCGTHRLLGKDVKFENLGLLILDEEQRFGVEAKETVKSLKKNVDVLTLSATPIPRTLHMALTGMRDISVLLTPPKERLPVTTAVIESNENILRDIILREVGRGGQVFFVYNRVEKIASFAAQLAESVPEVRIVTGHGQMDEKTLENNIRGFSSGLFDVLVSSSIIENGIDIPNANTLIVYDADNFGLSQLYQMRGRVGRSSRPAYAYFVYRKNKILNVTAYKRLSSVLEYTELGSGFKIAARDLEIRGAGNVMGREQHGHMEKVGYDMYCRLLAESVAEIRGIPAAAEEKTSVEVAVDASAANYIADDESRLSFYRRLAAACSHKEIEALKEEITDIFGFPPERTLNLLEIASFKIDAATAGFSEVSVKPSAAYACFKNADALKCPEVFTALNRFKGFAELDVSKKLRIRFKQGGGTAQTFAKVREFVQMIASGKNAAAQE